MAFWKTEDRIKHFFDLLAENLRYNVELSAALNLRYAAEDVNCEEVFLVVPGDPLTNEEIFAAFSDDYKHFTSGRQLVLWRWGGRPERAPAVMIICTYPHSHPNRPGTHFTVTGQRDYVIEALANLRSKFGEKINPPQDIPPRRSVR